MGDYRGPQREVYIADSLLEVVKGNVAGQSGINKFGQAPDFDTSDNEVDIWDGANDASPNLMNYIFSTTADIDSLSSSDDSDTQDIEVQGLDADYNLVTQTIALTGQTRVALTTNLIRVFRLKNMGATNNAGVIYCFKNVATTAGVPNTLANIRAMIAVGNNQTLMAIYTIPNGKTGYMPAFYAGIAGPRRDAAYGCKMYARTFGGVFQLKHDESIDDEGTSRFQHNFIMPLKFEAKTDIKITGQAYTASITAAAMSAGFTILLVDN